VGRTERQLELLLTALNTHQTAVSQAITEQKYQEIYNQSVVKTH